MSEDSDPPRKYYRLKPKEFERINVDPSHSSDPNEVHKILEENLSAANNAGLNDVAPPPRRRSRRLRDYIVAMVFGNLVLLIATGIAPILGIVGLVIYNLGVTWIVWVVMDRD
ncbi:MAG TPA: hypothetical protein VFT72_03770 [Opitutaceae bacterium]|nr:hypothetical protein [Opitutaceae bacterium]